MYQEVVSVAVIGSFVANIIFADHPNTTTYTIYFVVSLAAVTLLATLWTYLYRRRSSRKFQDPNIVENRSMEKFQSRRGCPVLRLEYCYRQPDSDTQ
ncbi:hypothetical protein B0O99DRAFT_622553 [Bisporella sp. PMI_857]|nr:hypothetical protein B0O99DRAFT_622553 [Bisporella sp. PMI_857]